LTKAKTPELPPNGAIKEAIQHRTSGDPECQPGCLSAFYYVAKSEPDPGKHLSVNITIDGRFWQHLYWYTAGKSEDYLRTMTACDRTQLKNEGIFKQSGKITIWVRNDATKYREAGKRCGVRIIRCRSERSCECSVTR
jgi:hypothetical protein